MKFCIYGPGAVGMYFGCKLGIHHDVHFLFRSSQKASDLKNCDCVKINGGEYRRYHVHHSAEDIGLCDCIILSYKMTRLTTAEDYSICPMIGDKTIVLPLMNGVGFLQTLSYCKTHVVGGLAHISVTKVATNEVKQSGVVPSVTFGFMRHTCTSCESTVCALNNAFVGVNVKSNWIQNNEDMLVHMWKKYVFIIGLTAVGCLYRESLRNILESQEGTTMLRHINRESCEVALKECEHRFDPDDIQDSQMFFKSMPYDDAYVSAQRDFLAQKPSEVEYQLQTLCVIAKSHSIVLPHITKLLTDLNHNNHLRQFISKPRD